MKRSEINRALRDMEKMIDRCSFKLPPFCYFTPEEWKEKGREYDEVRDNMLGGISRILEWGILTGWASPLSP